MFDIGWDEMLLTAAVAIVVIGPKDLPRALRTAGQWVGKVRRVSGHFRSGIEAMIRDAEIQEMEAKWRAQNEAIMREHPQVDPHPADLHPAAPEVIGDTPMTPLQPAASAEAGASAPTPEGDPAPAGRT
jgi:sec-independent protein translocase protein TatB